MPLILEGLVTTRDRNGKVNLAPMGPLVDRDLSQLTLRPFCTAQTFRNLVDYPAGMFHVTDDVLLLAKAAIGKLDPLPPMRPAQFIDVPMLADACRWLEFRVEEIDETPPRATIRCRIVNRIEGRPFFGFNRAKHAVVEAAILATRVGILPDDEIRAEVARLAIIVGKTAGDQEEAAFTLLREEIETRLKVNS